MTIPNKIKICGNEIKVVYDSTRCYEMNSLGFLLADRNEIVLDDTLLPDKLVQVFIHEVIHYINNILKKDECDNEDYVNPLSNMLYELFIQMEDHND